MRLHCLRIGLNRSLREKTSHFRKTARWRTYWEATTGYIATCFVWGNYTSINCSVPFNVKWKRIGITSGVPLQRNSKNRRQLTPELALALVLRYLATTTEQSDACAAFGLLPSSFSKYLRLGLKILNEVLSEIQEASFDPPTRSDMEYYASVVE